MTDRDAMLDAAEEVVLRDGIGGLTVEAVARQARLSKSGLLHHFPSKDALIDAMVRRKAECWRRECQSAVEAQGPGRGRIVRAMTGACLASTEHWNESMRRSGLVLVAALVHDPRHVEPLRQVHREIAAMLAKDRLAPGVGEAVQLAMDGLWFDWIFGLTDLTPQKLAAIRAVLRALAEREPARPRRKAPAAATKGRRSTPSAARPGKKRRGREGRKA